jgi:hypothetical protein
MSVAIGSEQLRIRMAYLVGEQLVLQTHGQVEYSGQRCHTVSQLEKLFSLLPDAHVKGRDYHLNKCKSTSDLVLESNGETYGVVV